MDDLFKEGFENWEAPPRDSVWNGIDAELEGSDFDDLFKEAFNDDEVVPSEKVWEGVQPRLPLNLTVKRWLGRLSIMAGVLIVGMLITLYVTQTGSSAPQDEMMAPLEAPVAVEEEAKEAEETPVMPTIETPEEIIEEELAIDPTINEEVKTVEVRKKEKKDEMFFDIDKKKIEATLQPIQPLDMEEAIARKPKNQEKDAKKKEGKPKSSKPAPPEIDDFKIGPGLNLGE